MKTIRLLLAAWLVFAAPVLAFAFTVSGRVTNQSNNPIAGAVVTAIGPMVASTTADGSGAYALALDVGTYDFKVAPPSGSGFTEATIPARVIAADTLVDFILVPAEAVTFTGMVLDSVGAVVPHARMWLRPVGGGEDRTAWTDESGRFSFAAAPGDYFLVFFNQNDATSASVPEYYSLTSRTISITGDLERTITLPFVRASVRVQDAAGNGLPDVSVITSNGWRLFDSDSFFYAGESAYYGWYGDKARTDSAGNAAVWLVPASYSFTARPSDATGMAATTVSDLVVTSGATFTITLEPSVRFTGMVLDSVGAVVPHARMWLRPVGGGEDRTAWTDESGRFSFTAAPGDYFLVFFNQNDAASASVPEYYSLTSRTISIAGDLERTITLPFVRASVRVQDAAGNGLPDVSVITSNGWRLFDSDSFFYAGESAYYGWYGDKARTDDTGNATVWLVPASYSFTARPPASSPFASFTVPDITISPNRSIAFVLQFIHPPPVSTATFSPAVEPDGTYGGPVSIALSAAATQGFSIAAINYELDGSAQQGYSAPISVPADGTHTLRYWAIDNAGVYEAPQTVTFVIASDKTPPTTTLTASPAPNASGWNCSDVGVTLTAADNLGGSGVSGIGLEIAGAQSGQLAVAGNTLTATINAEGVSTLYYFATDQRGNAESPKSYVIRIDRTAPVITSLTASPAALWPPNHKMAPVTVSAAATDAIGVVSMRIVSVTSNEPVDSFGDGDTVPDWEITGPMTVNLRAERSGKGDGRVYKITVEARDAAGNASTRVVTVSVPKNQAK